MSEANPKILVMGHRRGLTKSLEDRNIPYWLWASKAPKNKIKAQKQIIAAFTKKSEVIDNLLQGHSFDFVIAGTEEAVMPAAIVRGRLGTKRNPKTILLRCTDKYEMKKFLDKKSIPMTKYLSARKIKSSDEVLEKLNLPIVAKERISSGGRGIQFIDTKEELEPLLGGSMIFENKIEATEGSVESFVVRGEVVFSNISEYFQLGKCNLVPSHYPKSLQEKILALNTKVIRALNIKWGMTHLEFYIKGEELLFGELAMRPPGGYIMDCLKLSYGESFWTLFSEVETLQFSKQELSQKAYSASIILHPGEGVVHSIQGEELLKELPSLVKYKIKTKPDDKIEHRDALGEDCGYILLKNESQEQLVTDIATITNKFSIQLA